jgi:aspartyl-tRNA(Asn)/glutamyl-tRNA(Gln) amidotransferase subunit A
VKTVADAQIIFDAVRGHDPFDATSFPDALVAQKKVTHKKSLVIGVPEDLIATPGLDKDVRALFEKRLEALTSAGHTIKNISLPSLAHALAVYYIIMPAEASANLARFDGIRYGFSKDADKLLDVYMHSRGIGFGKEARRRVLLGTYVLSAGYYDAYYNKAALVRRMISDELAHAMKDVDVIATPTAPSPAFRIGEKTSDPLKMYLEDIFTVSANIAGVPALSVPSGVVSRDGVLLPVGIQFMAAAFHEATLFQIGTALEETL